jgi:hypothetical protein
MDRISKGRRNDIFKGGVDLGKWDTRPDQAKTAADTQHMSVYGQDLSIERVHQDAFRGFEAYPRQGCQEAFGILIAHRPERVERRRTECFG